jgi:hypothetical protein
MAENKNQQNDSSIAAFLDHVVDERKKQDSYIILKLMEELSGQPPKMWGESIIGFGTYHYKYESGREGDFLRIGFAPRKQNIALYLIAGANRDTDLLQKLGKYKTGVSCLYINKLADVNLDVLRTLITNSLAHMRAQYPE